MIKIKYIIIIVIFFIINNCEIFGQELNIKNGTYFYPSSNQPYQYKHAFNLSLSQLPEDMIEEVNSLIYSPLLIYDGTFSMPLNFNLHGCFTTNIVSNHFLVGTNWHHEFNNFAFAIGYDIAFWFGNLQSYDFKSRNVGWLHYPNLSIGYSFKKFTLTLKSEVVLNTAYTQFVDNIEVSTEKNTISGYSFDLLLEQPLWKNNFMIIGFKLNISRFYYSAWLAYTNNVQYRFIPEIQLGLVL